MKQTLLLSGRGVCLLVVVFQGFEPAQADMTELSYFCGIRIAIGLDYVPALSNDEYYSQRWGDPGPWGGSM